MTVSLSVAPRDMSAVVAMNDPQKARDDVLLVGLGASGQRFLRVIRHVQAETPSAVRLVGLVDRNIDRALEARRSFDAGEVPVFGNLDTALAALVPSMAVVAVNEQDHFEVLKRLAGTGIKHVLVEKPLTRTLAEAEQIVDLYTSQDIRVNLVERYSPIVGEYLAWSSEQPGLQLRRAQFHWGKHRVRDPRPTMGVLSEIIHPIDLIDCLAGFSQWRVLDGFVHTSDFVAGGDVGADSVHCVLELDGCVVSGHASFAWPDRRREVLLFLGDARGRLLQAWFRFDMPLWDCDTLTISQIDETTGNRKTIFHASVENASFDRALFQVYKVYRFFVESTIEVVRKPGNVRPVDCQKAYKLQRVLHDLEKLEDPACSSQRLLFQSSRMPFKPPSNRDWRE